MKIILTMIVSLFLAAAVSAQTSKPNYAGEWQLDVSKSTLPDAMRIESVTMKVSQTETELKVESTTKRVARSEGNETGAIPTDGNRGGRGMGRGGFGGSGTVVYSLPDKETTTDISNGTMSGKETQKPTFSSDGKLSLTVTRSFNNETGNITTKINETWELTDGGKTLKVVRYMETPRGATNAELYFTKKSSAATSPTGAVEENKVYQGAAITDPNYKPKKISGGVLNGKASSLPAPEYPAAARAVEASGTVNVQVTINEQGEIVSASAVSGHPLLRQAAEQAARKAKFAPTLLSGIPVSVTGVLVYNFVL